MASIWILLPLEFWLKSSSSFSFSYYHQFWPIKCTQLLPEKNGKERKKMNLMSSNKLIGQ